MPRTVAVERDLYHERKAAGLCPRCGRNPAALGVLCSSCGSKRLAYRRGYDGCQPWRPGGPGRPPLAFTPKPEPEAPPMPTSTLFRRFADARERYRRAREV